MSGVFTYNRNLVIHNIREYLAKTTYSKEVQAVIIEHLLQAIDKYMDELSKELTVPNYLFLLSLVLAEYIGNKLSDAILQADPNFSLLVNSKPSTIKEIDLKIIRFIQRTKPLSHPNPDSDYFQVLDVSPELRSMYDSGKATLKDMLELNPDYFIVIH